VKKMGYDDIIVAEFVIYLPDCGILGLYVLIKKYRFQGLQ